MSKRDLFIPEYDAIPFADLEDIFLVPNTWLEIAEKSGHPMAAACYGATQSMLVQIVKLRRALGLPTEIDTRQVELKHMANCLIADKQIAADLETHKSETH